MSYTVGSPSTGRQAERLPAVIIIDEISQPYSGGGESELDKGTGSRFTESTYGDQHLLVESYFSEGPTLEDLLAEYLLNQHDKFEVAGTAATSYTTFVDTAAAASAKEGV